MGKHVLLKDSWWVLLEGIKPEGKVYTLLHENAVPNISYCSLVGDVGLKEYHQSQTDKFANKYWQHPSASQFVPHWHYHLVLDTIGQDLKEFRCTKEMVNAVYASLVGTLIQC